MQKLAQNPQYKNWRHDQVAQVVHWNLCKKIYLQYNKTWYDDSPEAVMENDQVELLSDFRIQTVIVLENEGRVCYVIVDVAFPFLIQG